MGAGKYNFAIEQGADFVRTFIWKDSSGNPIDLTGYKAEMKIKLSPAHTEHLVWLTSETGIGLPGGIELGGANGSIVIKIDHLDTAKLNFNEAFYDLELTSADGNVIRLLEGRVTLSKEITK